MSETHSHLEHRLATVEANVQSISDNVARLAEAVEKRDEQTWGAIDGLRQARATNWPLVISLVMASFVIGAAILTPINSNITRNSENIAMAVELADIHEDKHSHTGAETQLRGLVDDYHTFRDDVKNRFDSLENALQREMRLLDTVLVDKVDHLDNRLQVEMKNLDDSLYWRLKFETLRDNIYPEKISDEEAGL